MQKRPSQFKRDALFKICQPFDHDAFNFCKSDARENALELGESILKVNISPLFPSHMLLAPLIKEYHPQFLESPAHLREALTLFT